MNAYAHRVVCLPLLSALFVPASSAQLTLPYSRTQAAPSPGYLFKINNSGTGGGAWFEISTTGIDAAVQGRTSGPGFGVFGRSTGSGAAVLAFSLGNGLALDVRGRSKFTATAQFANAVPFTVPSNSGKVVDLNADRLDGLDSLAFLQSIPVPLTLSGDIDGHVISGQNASTLGASVGVFGRSTGASGTTFGVRGQSDSTSGRGVSGYASSTSGINYGVYGSSESTSGRGVFGQTLNLTGTTYGGFFQSSSSTGIGTYGNGNLYGVYGLSSSSTGRGVYGFASGGGANNGTGVYGRNDSSNGWAVFAQGKSGASGTKSFCIDHPDDPANKYLLHYSVESPEVLNVYSGKATLDGAGEAVVELPHYFARINKDPRYTLTAIGAPMPMLHVAEEIDEAALSAGAEAEPGEAAPACWFHVAGGAPGAKVSWEVKALRNDRWVQQHGAPAEVEKEGLEKGTYQHPELYGMPPEMGMNYWPDRDDAALPK